MSKLVSFYSYEVMDGAVIESVSSEAVGHPAEHAIAPLETNFSWEADESSAQHVLVVDLGEPRSCDGFSFIHHETEVSTPLILSLDVEIKYSYDAVNWTTIILGAADDLADLDVQLKLRIFAIGRITSRYWQFTIKGTGQPFFYADTDARLSMLWLFQLDQLDRGAAFPVDDTPVYPNTAQMLPYGKVYRTGHNVNPHTIFTRTWMVTDTEYDVLRELMRKCNGKYRPFIMVDADGVRRLCKFSKDEIDEELLDVGLYRVTFNFVEIPLISKDKYH